MKSFVMVCALCAPGSSCVFFWTWYTCGSEATELNVAVESLESLCLCRRQRGCTTHHLAKYPYDRLNFHYVLLMFEFKSSNHIEAYHSIPHIIFSHLPSISRCVNGHQNKVCRETKPMTPRSARHPVQLLLRWS